jgi:6-phosphogluconolactonase
MAAQAAGDIGFVIESAIEAHKGARLALPGGSTSDLIFAQLAKSKGIDWSKVTIMPTDDRLVPLGDSLSNYRNLEGYFAARGANLVSLVDEAGLEDRQEAGRLADARLSLVGWPLDLACLGMGAEGDTAGIFPGPDLDRAVSGPRERRAVGVRPDPMPEDAAVDRVTLTAPGPDLGPRDHDRHRRGAEAPGARAGDQGRPALRRPDRPRPRGGGRPIDIFWSAEG